MDHGYAGPRLGFYAKDGKDRHIICEVVALLRPLSGLDRRRSFVDCRKPLVRLAADEAIEVFKAATARRPGIEGPDRTRLPDQNLMAFAELRCRVAIQLKGPRNRRGCVGQDRL
jgi:hypothetical protein